MKLSRELTLAVVLILGLAAGIGFDFAVDEVKAPERLPVVEPLFDERSVHCPSPPIEGESRSQLAIGSAVDEPLPVGIGEERIELPEGRAHLVRNEVSSEIVGYGGEVVASAVAIVAGRGGGVGAARCSKVASPEWYFAEGSSALGFDQRLVIYNPFPDEAVVSISLYTAQGQQGNANLAEGRAVPAGETIEVALNEFIRQQRLVGMSVVANRGRVIAWRAMKVNSEGRQEGTQFTLGATAPSDSWYFPEGAVQAGIDERITLLNPTEEEAIATLSLVTGGETVQPPRLVEVVVPPNSLLPLLLRDHIGGPQRNMGGAGVVVRTSSGGVVAERSVFYETDDLSGTASEVGSIRTSAEWFLGPSVDEPDSDSIVLLNPGAEEATVSISLLGEDRDPQRPEALQDLTLAGGTRLKVPIARWTRGRNFSVYVGSDVDVVAERFGSGGGDVASVIGLALAPSSMPTEQ